MKRATDFITRVVFRYIPDPLVVAFLLTFVTMLLAIGVERSSVPDVVGWWGDGFWTLLAFSMQMVVILFAGYMLATSPPVDRLLRALTSRFTNPNTAVFAATVISGIAMWLNWGFGLVVAGVLAKKFKEQIPSMNFPLTLASTYATVSVYGIGLSGTIPLLIATPDHFMQAEMGIVPLAETVFTPLLLATSAAVVLSIAGFNTFLHSRLTQGGGEASTGAAASSRADTSGERVAPAPVTQGSAASAGYVSQGDSSRQEKRTSPRGGEELSPSRVSPVIADSSSDVVSNEGSVAQRLNDSRVLGILVGGLGLAYVLLYFSNGGTVTLDIVNMMLLFLGFMLFARPSRYLEALQDAIKTVSGVVVQYPFYAGIMGILAASGLIVTASTFVAGFSTAENLPFISMLSGGLINLLAPSGGGQWAIQGPVMIETAQSVGSDLSATAMGVAMGDMWTNIIQPFWIIPALAISGLKLRDVMGYLVLNVIVVGVVLAGSILAWGYLL